jgi:hypothetical protein
MNKISIAKSKSPTISPDVSEAYAQSTPLTKALATLIMSFYEEKDETTGDPKHKPIQDLFNTWNNNDLKQMLAQLTEVLVGFKPVITVPSPFKVGQLFKRNGGIWLVITTGSSAYAINQTATSYDLINYTTDTSVSLAEAGEFAKDVLKLDGTKLLCFISKVSSSAVPALLQALQAKGLRL